MKRMFPSHEALVDSSGRADATTAERGDDHIEARIVNRDRSANPHF